MSARDGRELSTPKSSRCTTWIDLESLAVRSIHVRTVVRYESHDACIPVIASVQPTHAYVRSLHQRSFKTDIGAGRMTCGMLRDGW